MTKQCDCYERPNFIMVNREYGFTCSRQSWLLESGYWCRILSLVLDCIAGARMVVVGLIVTGSGLVAAVVGPVVTVAGR